MMAQKRLLLDFMSYMQGNEYKKQIEMRIAKEKVFVIIPVMIISALNSK